MLFPTKLVALVLPFLFITVMTSSSVEITIEEVHLTNTTELIAYAGLTTDNNCVPFNPKMKEPIDVSKLDKDIMYQLISAFANGAKVEICIPKDDPTDLEIEKRKKGWLKKVLKVVIAVLVELYL